MLMASASQAQHRHCSFDESQRAEIPQPTAAELRAYRLLFPPCNSPTATKNVRVNVHFMLDDGITTKMMNCWDTYRRDPLWASTGAADLLNHELGHLFGLIHDFEGVNTPPTWGDGCEDTPDHINCWAIWDTRNPLCSLWSNQSNNIMAYSEHKGALTPCQINKVHTNLSGVLSNYVHSCADCLPANAFYTMNPQFCARAKIGGGYFPVDVMLDGRGSFNEDSYLIEIFEVSAGSSNVIVSNHFMQQYSGQLGQINLRTFCNYNFQIGKTYRVRVMASKTNCLPTSEQTQWISIVACTPETSTPTPTVPIKKSLTIIARQPKNYILHSEIEQQAQVFIYDFTGRLLYQLPKMSLQTGENSLELSSLDLLLSNNFYILAVQTAEGVETHRFNIP